jgi:hypothetical protein
MRYVWALLESAWFVSGWTNILLIAFAVIIGGTLLGEHTATFGERYTADKGPGNG